ncbi:MAG: ParA family protein [Coleofasciculus sp. A1-SPW-01]|uniref:ParA family protein n=1 Tax=Coleofasciculus sp. A1-SPW-01 TaxID=3070819 RepID=UPI0032FA90EC
MRTIAIHTSKGGVGKTTLVVNLAYELAKLNYRVLVVDLDDQANASLSLGVNKADQFDKASSFEEFKEILDTFKERKELIDFLCDHDLPSLDYQEYIRPSAVNADLEDISTCSGIIDVLPGSYRTTDKAISSFITPQTRLDTALQTPGISNNYDYVIIDTPPSSTDIAKGGLIAAQYLLIPTQLEYLSVYGINTPLEYLRQVQKQLANKRGVVLGIVPMMTQKRSRLNSMVRKLLEKRLETEDNIPILPEIHRSDYISQASRVRQPISLFAQQKSQAENIAKEFIDLTQKVLERIEVIEKDKKNA